MFSDILVFLLAVVSHWQSYVTGGAMTGLLTIIERLTDWKMSKKAYAATFLGVFLLVSFFLVWRDEHKALVAEHKALVAEQEKNGSPRFSATMDGYSRAPGRSSKESIVTVFATIRNTGAPSIAENFRLQIKTGSGIFDGKIIPPPDEDYPLSLRIGEDPRMGMKLRREDSLMTKTSYQPIPHNGASEGFEMFYVNIPKDEIGCIGCEIILSFSDVFGNSYSAAHKVTEQDHPVPNISNLQGRYR